MCKDNIMNLIKCPESLPERAYRQLPTDKTQVIIIVNGETGYYKFQKYETEAQAKETCEYCNEKFGVSAEEAEALMILSMRHK